MKKQQTLKLFCVRLLSSLFFLSLPFSALAFNPNYLISDHEFIDRFALDLGTIQNILMRGRLASYVTEDVDGALRPAAQIIWRAGQRNGISPKVILTMLQKEQSLVEDPSPSPSQFDWAMGYGICDTCSYDTDSAQRFRGFAKQINSATLQLSDGYLADLAAAGRTVAGFAPGIPKRVDDIIVTPENNATAALYTYTPHIEGNRNFVAVLERYFGGRHPTGTLLQNRETGGVFLIQFGKKRPILSRAALISRYDPNRVISVDPSVLDTYENGATIAFPNYSLLRDGTRLFLLVDDTLRPFTDEAVFQALGFNSDELVDVTPTDLAGYEIGTIITSETAYATGIVFRHETSGTLYYVEDGKRALIASNKIRQSRFAGRAIVPASSAQLESFRETNAIRLLDGTLVKFTDDPTVYVISEGTRRPIENEASFKAMGWTWDKVEDVSRETLAVHPLGTPISLTPTL